MNEFNFTTLKNDPAYSLSQSERERMRTELAALVVTVSRTPSRASLSWFDLFARQVPVVVGALILMMVAGSVSFAAEGALPGDTLYGFKVAVNESVATTFSLGEASDAKTRVRHAEERLRETEVLAARGTFDEAQAEYMAEAVTETIRAASASASALLEEGNIEEARKIRASIASALTTHAQLIEVQAIQSSDELGASLRTVSGAALAVIEEEVPLGQALSGDDESVTYEQIAIAQRVAENGIGEFRSRLKRQGSTKETLDELERELTSLGAEFQVADRAFAERQYARALLAYETISARAYRAHALLHSAQDIAQKSEKEVVIVLMPHIQEPLTVEGVASARMKEGDEATAMTMSLAATELADQTLAEETSELSVRSVVPTFEFHLRDRLED